MENKRHTVDDNAIKANIAKRKATEAKVEVWLSKRRVETPNLNWTVETVKLITRELGLPLEDVLDWTSEALEVLAKELGILLQNVFDSAHILEAIERIHNHRQDDEVDDSESNDSIKCRDCKRVTSDYYADTCRCKPCQEALWARSRLRWSYWRTVKKSRR